MTPLHALFHAPQLYSLLKHRPEFCLYRKHYTELNLRAVVCKTLNIAVNRCLSDSKKETPNFS